MPRVTPIQTNFTAGELSPRLDGRVDFEKYFNGAKTMEHAFVLPHGGATRRHGTQFILETKDSTVKSRLIPFEFNTEQAYIIESGNLYFRFYRDQGNIETGPSTPYEIATPYVTADIPTINFTQSADTMWLVHSNYAPRKLTRTGHTAWTLTEIEFTDGPYLPVNATATTITPSATTGSITLTASAALFQSGHVGALWQITHGATTGYVKITGFTSSTLVNADVKTTLGGTSATSDWAEGAWSGVRGYPRAVTFFQNRIIYGGTSNNPQTIWGSKTEDYDNMTAGVNDADAFLYTIASRQVNVIRWLAPTRSLVVGTSGGEFTISAVDGGPLTPTSVNVTPESTYGSAEVAPAQIGNSVLYIQRAGNKLREARYELDNDAYKSRDLTLLSEHITDTGLAEVVYQQEPDSLVWMRRTDGTLVGMTYERDQEVIGWHRHPLGTVESIAVIPASGYDELWCIVNRTINGATKRYVEVFDPKEWSSSTLFPWEHLNTDSALTYVGSAVSSVSGLDHLEGETVKVIVEGAVHPDRTVTSGAITLDDSYTEIEVGLGYTTTIQTMRPEVNLNVGTSQAKKKRWNEIFVRLFESLGVKINDDQIPFRTSADPMDEGLSLFTGLKRVTNLGYDEDGFVTIKQEQPLPLTVLMITGTLNVND